MQVLLIIVQFGLTQRGNDTSFKHNEWVSGGSIQAWQAVLLHRADSKGQFTTECRAQRSNLGRVLATYFHDPAVYQVITQKYHDVKVSIR